MYLLVCKVSIVNQYNTEILNTGIFGFDIFDVVGGYIDASSWRIKSFFFRAKNFKYVVKKIIA